MATPFSLLGATSEAAFESNEMKLERNESAKPTNMDTDRASLGTGRFFTTYSSVNMANLSFYERAQFKHSASQRNLEKLRFEKKLQDQENEAQELTFTPQTNRTYVTAEGVKRAPSNRNLKGLVNELASPRGHHVKTEEDDPDFHELKEKPEINPLSNQLSVIL